MKRHVVKITILVLGVTFLGWWGWSGYFSFNPDMPFRLAEQDEYYSLSFGRQPMGWARRTISASPNEGMIITEDSVVSITLAGTKHEIRPQSRSVFDNHGRLIDSVLTIPVGIRSEARISVANGQMKCELNLGSINRQVELSIPEEGPLLASGVLPWLSRQSESYLGQVMVVSIFDPVKLAFESAELTVVDDTPQAAEIEVYKVSIKFSSTETIEWVDANGLILRQLTQPLEVRLDRLEYVDQAKKALEASPQPFEIGDITEDNLLMFKDMGEDWMSSLVSGDRP